MEKTTKGMGMEKGKDMMAEAIDTAVLTAISIVAGFLGMMMLFGECSWLGTEMLVKAVGFVLMWLAFRLWPFGMEGFREEVEGWPDGWSGDRKD